MYQPTLFDPDQLPTPLHTPLQAARRASEVQSSSRWTVLTSTIEDYEKTFRGVLSDVGGEISNLIPEKDIEEPAVAVDLMASPVALQGLRRQFYARRYASGRVDFQGFAVALKDSRPGDGSAITEEDHRLGLHFLAGNLRYPATWNRLEQVMGGLKADIIMERAVGGLGALPGHYAYYGAAFQRLWRVLRPGGVMLLQVPGADKHMRHGISLQTVVERLAAQGVTVQKGMSVGDPFKSLVLRIQHPGK